VLTPAADTSPAALSAAEGIVRDLGADPVRLSPEAHDHVVAVVSHLPQVVSTALMNLAAREEEGQPQMLLLAAGGFRDLTRLAASNARLWAGILPSNRQQLVRALDAYIDELRRMQGLVEAGDRAGLEAAFEAAMRERIELHAKPHVRTGMAVLQIPVPDRPGVLAELTAALGERGVNIEDIEIVHSPEGGRGAVHLTVSAETAGAAGEALAAHEFEAVRLA
jgi:prephenate dehydrogenase